VNYCIYPVTMYTFSLNLRIKGEACLSELTLFLHQLVTGVGGIVYIAKLAFAGSSPSFASFSHGSTVLMYSSYKCM